LQSSERRNVIIALYNRIADKNYHNPGILKKTIFLQYKNIKTI